MGIDVVTLALAKGYTDGKIQDAAFGDVPLDTSLTKKGQAADAKAVGDAIGKLSGGIAVTGAKVGQTVKISAVDENGVPTAWESVDFPSGGETEVKEWEEFLHFTTDNAETTVFDFSSNGTETLESRKVKEFYIYSPEMANTGCGIASVLVNDRVNITGLTDFGRVNNGSMKLGLFTSSNSLDIWYFGRDTSVGLDGSTSGISCNTIPAVEKNGLLEVSLNVKHTWRKIYYYHNGIPLPGLPIDYIKSVVVTTASACSSGVEFIVYVR